jgi:hypothetical protein
MLALTSYWSCRLAFADYLFRQNTRESVAQALRWDRFNAGYYTWQAELQEFAGVDPASSLDEAVRLNRYASGAWVRLAARSEMRGDFPAAERQLLVAEQVDRLFDTRWALMNFYFRRGDAEKFWFWTRKSLEMSYGDLTSLFELVWRFTDDGERMNRALPEDVQILNKYLYFLTATNRLTAGGPIALRLLRDSSSKDVPVLLHYGEEALEASRTSAAIVVWNGLCERKLLTYKKLSPERAQTLTNADFMVAAIQTGFDWRFSPNPEVTILQPIPEGGVRISLNGKQSETEDLAWQVVPLLPGRRYRLQFDYRTADMRQTGVCWIVRAGFRGLSELGHGAVLAPREEWQHADVVFSSGEANTARLVLRYERELGTMRAEGTLDLKDLTLGFAE